MRNEIDRMFFIAFIFVKNSKMKTNKQKLKMMNNQLPKFCRRHKRVSDVSIYTIIESMIRFYEYINNPHTLHTYTNSQIHERKGKRKKRESKIKEVLLIFRRHLNVNTPILKFKYRSNSNSNYKIHSHIHIKFTKNMQNSNSLFPYFSPNIYSIFDSIKKSANTINKFLSFSFKF